MEPVTRAKFVSSERIVVSTTHGTVWSVQVLKDSQQNLYLERPVAVYRNPDLSAIWDLAVIDVTGLTQNAYSVIAASDSGEVKLIHFDHLHISKEQTLLVSLLHI